ncbi:ankyrin repeat domain-containing protein [Lentisphaerota bacterium WC36G]|nr:ankyrin repeat domain-containing protein [Lentisphaerae bacterium WC36]
MLRFNNLKNFLITTVFFLVFICGNNMMLANKKQTTTIKKGNKKIIRTDQYVVPGQNYRPIHLKSDYEYLEEQFYARLTEAIIQDLTNTDKTVKKVDKKATKINISNINKVFIENCIDALFINKRASRLKYTYKKGLDLYRLKKLDNAISYIFLAYLASECNDKNTAIKLLGLSDKKFPNYHEKITSKFLKFLRAATLARIFPSDENIQKKAVADFFAYSDTKQPNLLNVRLGLQIIKKCSVGVFTADKWLIFYNGLTKKSSFWLRNMITGYYNLYRAKLAEQGKIKGKTTKESSDAYYLALAGHNFKNAIEIYQSAPESFSEMIFVCNSGSMTHRHNPRFYFDQAVMASFDFQDAYKYMLEAALKSTNLMNVIRFGDECLKTKRFDTNIPLYYASSLALSGYYMPAFDWRRPFHLKSVKEKLANLLNGYKENNKDNRFTNDEIATLELLFSFWTSDYKKAQEILNKNLNIPQYEKNLRIPFIAGKKFYELSRGEFRDILELYTSEKYAKELISIDKLLNLNKFKMAIDKLDSLQQKVNEPKFIIYLARKSIYLKNNYSANRMNLDKRELLEFVVDKGGIIELNNLLKILFNPNITNEIKSQISSNKRSVIVPAIESNQSKALKILLKYYSPKNMAGYQENALFYAIENDNVNAVEILLKDRNILSSINEKYQLNGLTALTYATLLNNVKIVSLLLDLPNIDINKTAGLGKDTALHIAASLGYFQIVMKLLNKEADRNIKNSASLTAMDIAKNEDIRNFIKNYYYKKK